MTRQKPILKVWALVALLSLPQAPAAGQNPRDIIRCDEIVVKDYPLPALIQRFFETCGRRLEYAEDIPDVRVTLNYKSPGGSFSEILRHVGDKTGLAFQPVLHDPGKFTSAGYVPGGAPGIETWIVCQTSAPATPGKKKFRMYHDPANNQYRIVMNEAPVKELIDRLYRLYNNSTFTDRVVDDLTRLNIDLADNKLKFFASFDLVGGQLDLAVARRLNEKLFQAWLARNNDTDVDIWPLTYIGGRRQTAGGGSGNGADNSSESYPKIDELLNWSFGDKTAKLSRQNLFISGSAETRLKVKRLMARIDAPWPQVQMNMWAVQLSGKPEKIGPQLVAIKKAIALTQGAMAEAQQALNGLLRRNAGGCLQDCQDVLSRLRRVHFDRGYGDALSLNEALILLAIHDRAASLVAEYEAQIRVIQERLTAAVSAACTGPELCNDATPGYRPATLGRMAAHYSQGTQPAVRVAITGLTDALINFRDNTDDPTTPAELQQRSAVADRLIKSAVDAYAADMQEAFLDPLLLRLQSLNACRKRTNWNEEGVTITGRTRIVVTSRLSSTLEPAVKSYANISRPKPLGEDFLKKAFPNNADGKAAPRVPLLDLETFPALLLAAGLVEEKPVFNEVAPGVRVSVRPTVVPDGSSARLELECSFGVATKLPGSQEDIWGQTQADAVESHRVSTDAAISVFDLFDISSFSIDSSHPQAPYYVPVLGRLPFVGPAFQWPRNKKRVRHESLILVNTVILPRALDLARYYGN